MHHRNRVLLINIRGHRKHFLAEMVWKKKMKVIFIKTFIFMKLEKVCTWQTKTSFWSTKKKSTGKVRIYDV